MTKGIISILALIGIWQYSFAQHIEFKDPLFKKCLLDTKLGIDSNNNNEIELSEAKLVKSLEINDKGLTNISEILFFKNLEFLNCNDNKIDSLIIKDLPKLKEIYCRTNSMTFLKLESLNSLEELISGINQLSSIEINECPNLEVLYLQENKLTSIDLSKFPLLRHLILPNNELTSIDISSNPELVQITVDYNHIKVLDIRKNLKIKYIYVDDNVDRIMTEQQKKNSPFLTKIEQIAPPKPAGN